MSRKGEVHLKRLFLIMVLFLAAQSVAEAVPSFEDVRARHASSDALLRDRHGSVIQELRVDREGRRLAWVRLSGVSPALVRAVVLSEDRRFSSHRGVDWTALASTAVRNLFSHRPRGASTITMQLASLIDTGLRPRQHRRSSAQKWEQIMSARELERTWTKDQILEAYLNLVSFRGELQGIAAASRGIFDKDPSGLDEAESYVLAALIPSPNASPERAGARAAALAQAGSSPVKAEEITALARTCLSRPYRVRPVIELAPHAAHRLLQSGARDRGSTVDGELQRFVLEALKQALGLLAGQNVRDGAVLVVDNRSGDVLAYAGNTGDSSSARFVDGVLARRQAGSTLKPFLYALAFERRVMTPASLTDDTPLDLPTERGVFRPENYDHDFRGAVPARIALASSLNIPAVRTLALMGTDAFVRHLQAFGFSGLREPAEYGPSLALGTADISLWDLVNAYRTLANGGTWSRLRLAPDEEPGPRRRVLSRETSFLISDILSDRAARSATFSLESPLATRFWTAVKTGTSKDMRDNWCIGYSDRYTVGVWVGNFSGASMWDVSGVSGAAPVWLEIMNRLHAQSASRGPVRPEGVRSRLVVFEENGRREERRELFLAGTEQEFIRPRTGTVHPRIIYPAPETVIALDPDIPRDLQRVFLESSVADPQFSLRIDETTIGQAPLVPWQPTAGKHVLSLLAADGRVADQISFEVK